MNNKLLAKDTTIKILSVVFAALLWFYVITEQNPVVAKDITIPVQLTNLGYLEQNSMVLMGTADSFKVTISLKGKNNLLDTINETTISAFADLNGHVKEGENLVPISLNGIPEGISWFKPSISYIKVFLEPKVSAQKTVEVKLTGSPSVGLAAMKAVVDPADVIISGPESYVRKVQTVSVEVDINGASSDVSRNLTFKLLDKDGNEVTNITSDTKRVNVLVPIANTKSVPIQYDVTGIPAEGHELRNVYIYPKEILIAGKQETLNNITFVKTARIDITGVQTSLDQQVELELPLGVELANKADKVRINVDIEEIITKTVDMSFIEVRGLSSGYTYSSFDQNVKLTVKGAKSLIDNLNEVLKLYVDMKNAVEGINTVNIQWEKEFDIEILDILPSHIDIEVKRSDGAGSN